MRPLVWKIRYSSIKTNPQHLNLAGCFICSPSVQSDFPTARREKLSLLLPGEFSLVLLLVLVLVLVLCVRTSLIFWAVQHLMLFVCSLQLLRGGPDSLLRSLHIKKDPTAFSYIKVGGQIKVEKNKR